MYGSTLESKREKEKKEKSEKKKEGEAPAAKDGKKATPAPELTPE